MFLDAFFGIFTVSFGISKSIPKHKKLRITTNPKLKAPVFLYLGMILGLSFFMMVFSTFYSYNSPYFLPQIMGLITDDTLQTPNKNEPESIEDVIERFRKMYGYYNTEKTMVLSASGVTDSIVTVAEDLVFGPWNTEQGSITEIDRCIDMSDLPLCNLHVNITNNWWILYKVVGGYEPINGTDWYFSQKGDKIYNYFYPNMWVGYKVIWYYAGHSQDNCCTDYRYADGRYNGYWLLTFDDACNNWGCIDSNQYPAGAETDSGCCTIPGKEVLLNVSTLWSGCDNEDQQFTLISLQEELTPNIL